MRAVIESGLLKRLGRLDLYRDRVTPAGLDALRRAGVAAVAENAAPRRESEEREFAEREAYVE